jgi:hypothetical protein
MDGERLERSWAVLQAEVGRELSRWRAAHPQATLAEIEQTVAAAVQRLQGRYLADLAHASAAANLAAIPVAERPPCPECGGVLEPRGRDVRRVVAARQAVPLELWRSYAVCAACGSGLFPPG